MLISKADKEIIRDLAKKQKELASSPEMDDLKKEWLRNNDCLPGRPMATVEWGTFEQEVFPPILKTSGKLARIIEKVILSNFVGRELFHDDSVVNGYVGIGRNVWFRPFGMDVKVERLKDSVGHHFVEQINDLEADFHLLKRGDFGTSRMKDFITLEAVESLVGDILPVKYAGRGLYSVPTQDVVHIMGLQNMMLSMYDYPDKFHKMMEMLTDDYIRYFDYLSKKGYILPTNAGEWVGQGTYAFTSGLKGEAEAKEHFTPKDVWGFMDSQETSTISPSMYAEFVFPYYEKIAKGFGRLSYGCCEAVHPIWDNCLSKLNNLHKVSISPWCDEEFMGERLRGSKIVYHRKPSPNFIGVDRHLDEEAFRKYIGKTLKAAKGCNIEFTQRDVYTVHGDMGKVRDYVRIIREECAAY